MRSIVSSPAVAPEKRNLKKVPFVELFAGKLQGVVSSGSDIRRVYVSWLEAGSGDFGCSTNNNRPCGGLRGGPCKHIQALVDNAVAQYGEERVATFFGRSDRGAYQLSVGVGGTMRRESSGEVFARFLDYLGYLELEPPRGELPEMAWFYTS